ncbi:hypothetical protein SUGI_0995300 [Cryptomeria japonica]|nr:hypothetical protein SUGI_0995300 [Cryptomeria japonica]
MGNCVFNGVAEQNIESSQQLSISCAESNDKAVSSQCSDIKKPTVVFSQGGKGGGGGGDVYQVKVLISAKHLSKLLSHQDNAALLSLVLGKLQTEGFGAYAKPAKNSWRSSLEVIPEV